MRKVLIALSLILAQILVFISAIHLFYTDFLMIIIIMGSMDIFVSIVWLLTETDIL